MALDSIRSEPGICIGIEEVYRKALLVASASNLKKQLQDIVEEFVVNASSDNERLLEFVRNAAIKRRFHDWFDWQSGNANKFYSLFGREFKTTMNELARVDETFANSVSCFVGIGSKRNILVHEDFIANSIQDTCNEIHVSFLSALYFIQNIRQQLAAKLSQRPN